MNIKKRLNKIEKIVEDNHKDFIKNITDLIDKGHNKFIQEVIRRAKALDSKKK